MTGDTGQRAVNTVEKCLCAVTGNEDSFPSFQLGYTAASAFTGWRRRGGVFNGSSHQHIAVGMAADAVRNVGSWCTRLSGCTIILGTRYYKDTYSSESRYQAAKLFTCQHSRHTFNLLFELICHPVHVQFRSDDHSILIDHVSVT